MDVDGWWTRFAVDLCDQRGNYQSLVVVGSSTSLLLWWCQGESMDSKISLKSLMRNEKIDQHII